MDEEDKLLVGFREWFDASPYSLGDYPACRAAWMAARMMCPACDVCGSIMVSQDESVTYKCLNCGNVMDKR